jgi:hypothetical protein
MFHATLPSTGLIPTLFMGRPTSAGDVMSEDDTWSVALSLAISRLPSTGDWKLSSVDDHLRLFVAAPATTNVTEPIEEKLNWLVANGVRIENPSLVRAYLLQYSDLLIVVPSVWQRASELLSSSTQFTLAVYRDPEIRDEYLSLYARQREYEENILESIDAINSLCEELLSGLNGFLLTTTDFRAPI